MPTDDLTELFRPIEGFPSYRVSNLGRVQTCVVPGTSRTHENTWRDRRAYEVKKKYGKPHLAVMLHREGKPHHFLVHRLVLAAFVGPCPAGLQCLHRDGNPRNNRVDNLRWGTQRENSADAVRHGVMRRGSGHGVAKLDEERVAELKRMRREGKTIKSLAVVFRVSVGTVCNIVNGRAWKHVT
jgi:hypothetical protein